MGKSLGVDRSILSEARRLAPGLQQVPTIASPRLALFIWPIIGFAGFILGLIDVANYVDEELWISRENLMKKQFLFIPPFHKQREVLVLRPRNLPLLRFR